MLSRGAVRGWPATSAGKSVNPAGEPSHFEELLSYSYPTRLLEPKSRKNYASLSFFCGYSALHRLDLVARLTYGSQLAEQRNPRFLAPTLLFQRLTERFDCERNGREFSPLQKTDARGSRSPESG